MCETCKSLDFELSEELCITCKKLYNSYYNLSEDDCRDEYMEARDEFSTHDCRWHDSDEYDRDEYGTYGYYQYCCNGQGDQKNTQNFNKQQYWWFIKVQ